MLKKFLIVASMICVLVSSLVVVSFADTVYTDTYNAEWKYSIYDYEYVTSVDVSVSEGYTVNDFANLFVSEFYLGRSFVVIETSENTYVCGDGNIDYSGSNFFWNFNEGVDSYEIVLSFYENFALRFHFDENGNFTDCFFSQFDIIILPSEFTISIYSENPLPHSDGISGLIAIRQEIVVDDTSPSYLLSLLFTGFGSAIGGLALGVKESLSNVIWVDPTATNKVLSPLVTFIFTIAGLSIAMTVFFLIFRLIRFGRQR